MIVVGLITPLYIDGKICRTHPLCIFFFSLVAMICGWEVRKMKNKKIRYLLITLLMLIMLLILLLSRCSDSEVLNDLLPIDESAESWNGNQNLPGKKGNKEQIEISGFSSLCFEANETKQSVNFCNPESNEGILFQMTLFVEESEMWKSNGLCSPGRGYYEINLNEPLSEGEYEAYLLIECYREDGTQLNGARVDFILTVQ